MDHHASNSGLGSTIIVLAEQSFAVSQMAQRERLRLMRRVIENCATISD